MTTPESAGVDQDLWHVEVAPNDVRSVTLEQLDEAFQQGLVTESTRVWQEGMPCAMSLGELLGGEDEPAGAADPEPSGYAAPEPAYAAPPEPAYVAAREPAYAPGPSHSYRPEPLSYAPAQAAYAAPQPAAYVPPQSPPPASRAPESAWPPVVAASQVAPARSSVPVPASAPPPPSMAPLAFDVPELDNPYTRPRGGKGKFLVAAIVLGAIGSVVAVQLRAQADSAAAVQAPPPAPAPEPPKSHAYDPGPPVKVGESKPPLELTVREPSKTDDKSNANAKKVDPKLTMASGKKPKPAPRSRRAAPSNSAGASHFKLGKSGSKYDPLNGSL